MALDSIVSINQTICGCDGTISVYAYGGNPPYTYSIDTGISYKNSPLFYNLCSGLYSVVTKDVSGVTSSKTIFLESPSGFTLYSVSLETTSSQSISSPFLNTFNYVSNIVVTPELPSGTTLTFDLRHTNTTNSSPSITACTATTTSQLEINSVVSGMSFSSVTTGQTYNPTPGCQNETNFINSLTEVWSNITYNLGDEFILNTTTSISKNVDIDCYLGNSNDVFTITNLRINGCGCCKAIVT
jgi:hypothetical protein